MLQLSGSQRVSMVRCLATVLLIAGQCLLALSSDAESPCFYGGTNQCQFSCNCGEGEACVVSGERSGQCPSPEHCDDHHRYTERMAVEGNCQFIDGNIGWDKPAYQTGNSDIFSAEMAFDGNSSYANPQRESLADQLYWHVDLVSDYAVEEISFTSSLHSLGVYLNTDLHTLPMSCNVGFLDWDLWSYQCWPDSYELQVSQDVVVEELFPEALQFQLYNMKIRGYKYHECTMFDGDYRWGPACMNRCHCQSQCDVLSGACWDDCTPGWQTQPGTPSLCDTPCYFDEYGRNCDSHCACGYFVESCNSATGECGNTCSPGLWGNGCDQTCSDGYWGADCVNACTCDVPCGIVTGVCVLCSSPWVTGERCDYVLPEYQDSDSISLISVVKTTATFSLPYVLGSKTEIQMRYNDSNASNWTIKHTFWSSDSPEAIFFIVEIPPGVELQLRAVPWDEAASMHGRPTKVLSVVLPDSPNQSFLESDRDKLRVSMLTSIFACVFQAALVVGVIVYLIIKKSKICSKPNTDETQPYYKSYPYPYYIKPIDYRNSIASLAEHKPKQFKELDLEKYLYDSLEEGKSVDQNRYTSLPGTSRTKRPEVHGM